MSEYCKAEVGEDCISREYIVKKLKSSKEFYLSAWGSFSNMDDKDKARCDELNNCIATVINAPSVIPQVPNEDAISRATALEIYSDLYWIDERLLNFKSELDKVYDELRNAPSVVPTADAYR